MNLKDLQKYIDNLIKANPKNAHLNVRLKQYNEIYHDINGTVSAERLEVRKDNEIWLG